MIDIDTMFVPAITAASFPKGQGPRKHRGPKVNNKFPDGLRYRRTHYVHDCFGRRVCWIWSTTRNEDGLFIGCREVYFPKLGKGFRDTYRARKARWRVKDWAMYQFNCSPYRKQSWTYPLKRDKKR